MSEWPASWRVFAAPSTARSDHVDDYHGTLVADPYRWLEDSDHPERDSWIRDQNAFSRGLFQSVASHDAIASRLNELWDHPTVSPPIHAGDRYFQMRHAVGENQPVLWVMDAVEDDGRVLIDPNTLADDGTAALGAVVPSHNGALVSWARSDAGSDWITWRVRDVARGVDLSDLVEWTKTAMTAWDADDAGFFYCANDAPVATATFEDSNLGQRVMYHRLGDRQADDVVVFAPDNHPTWRYLLEVTEDRRYLIIIVFDGTDARRRVYYVDLEERGLVHTLFDLGDAHFSVAGTVGTTWYLQTDVDAPRGRVVAVDIDNPDVSEWREVVAESEDALGLWGSSRLFGGEIVTVHTRDSHSLIKCTTLDGTTTRTLPLPGIGAVPYMQGRRDDDVCFSTFESFSDRPVVLRHSIEQATTAVLDVKVSDEATSSAGEVECVTEQVFVDASDGASVPMFLTHRKDVERTGHTPVLLHAYGGFGVPKLPSSEPWTRLWVQLGGVFASAGIRGGGEYGLDWHDAGRLANRQRSFDDFIACGEWLVADGWTNRAHLAIHGRSNGGLLVAACLTQRADLFGAAVAEVPVVDMLRYHRFTIGWGWTTEYGCADDPEQFDWLYAYSPVHRAVKGTKYPPTLITTGDHDDRVVPAHSFKLAAALQFAQGGDGPIALRVETGAGHGAGKPRAKAITERADVVTFLVGALGLSV